jgi:hypothetical protein
MSESLSLTIVILLSLCVGLLVWVLVVVLKIGSRVGGLSGNDQRSPGGGDSRLASAETSPGGAFEAFLSENPARRHLPKGEQFSAYRRWRQEKGLNWSNP